VILTNNYWLEKHDGLKFRSRFMRLVTDEADDDASADHEQSDPDNQTIRVKLGDTLRISYEPVTGKRVFSEIQVGRPSSEDDNGADPKKHDIRELKVNIVVFSKHGVQESCVTKEGVDRDVQRLEERMAQANIKINVLNINMGPKVANPGGEINGIPINGYHDGGVELPTGTGINWSNGFDAAGGISTSGFSPEEHAIFGNYKDSDPNSIDIFYFEKAPPDVTTGPLGLGTRGWSYFVSRNNPIAYEDNNIVLLPGRGMLTLAHECMHILRNLGAAAHDEDPDSLSSAPSSDSVFIDINGHSTKRIGPFNGNDVPDQTKTIRDHTETLPARQ
jgi:hypothetical protein